MVHGEARMIKDALNEWAEIFKRDPVFVAFITMVVMIFCSIAATAIIRILWMLLTLAPLVIIVPAALFGTVYILGKYLNKDDDDE